MVEHVIDPARLSRSWFRRRAAWQAVSDLIKDERKISEFISGAEQHLRWANQGGRRSVPVGFFSEQANKQELQGDIYLIYNLVIATLCGGATLNERSAASDDNVTTVQRHNPPGPVCR